LRQHRRHHDPAPTSLHRCVGERGPRPCTGTAVMKNGRVRRCSSMALAAMVALAASGAHAQSVQDSPPPPAGLPAAPPANQDLLSFVDGSPLLGGKPLAGDAFYRLVGRPDLAERYRLRQSRKSDAVAIGLFVTVPSVLW